VGNGQISTKVSFFRSEPNSLDLLALKLDCCNQPVSDGQHNRQVEGSDELTRDAFGINYTLLAHVKN
jgi:hypothetical protein